MQHSAQSSSGRRQERVRQERVPLGVGIDLRGLQLAQDEALEADGLNVSIGGIAVRAAVEPSIGARVECSFACPPTGETVHAQGEVMWTAPYGDHQTDIGLRFVELDTKSATALRRYLRPAEELGPKPERVRAATLTIDGLGSPLEAELKLADDGRIVLEQQLSFLQVGRGIEVSMPGRGVERGRIASVELKHGFDAPTLVFGVLLDASARTRDQERQNERLDAAAAKLSPLFATEARPPNQDRTSALPDEPTFVDERRSSVPPLPQRASSVPPEPPVTASVRARMHERVSQLRLAREQAAQRTDAELSDLEHVMASAPSEMAPLSHEGDFSELPGEPTKRAQIDLPLDRPVPFHEPTSEDFKDTAGETARVRVAEAFHPSASLRTKSAGSGTLAGGLFAPAPSAAVAAHDAAASAEPRLLTKRVSGADSAAPLEVEDAELAPEDLELISEEDPEDVASQQAIEQDDSEPMVSEAEAPAASSDSGLHTLSVRNLPSHLRALFRAQGARLQDLRQRIEPTLREQAEYFDLPDAKSRMLLKVARLRGWLLQLFARARGQRIPGVRAARPMRVQRSTLTGLGPSEPERTEPSRRTRVIAAALIVAGVGLGLYALAPVSGADHIKVPERVQTQADSAHAALLEPASEDELDALDDSLEADPPKRKLPKSEPARDPATRAASEGAAVTREAPRAKLSAVAEPVSPVFGEPSLPDGRTFALRMNGPVTALEGQARENGITVRVPGRASLDRASPIASAHNGVERALILNRAGFAELTLDFAAGSTPRYQVRGKGDMLEVTLDSAR